jgi:hypothetical protein
MAVRRSALAALAILGVGVLGTWGAAVCAGPRDLFLPPPPGPDRDFYLQRLAPWIDEQCATCHRGAGAGGLVLAPDGPGVDVAARRRADFERLRPFVNPQAPRASRLFLKLVGPAEGGEPHVGGVFVHPDGARYDTLLDFVSGATPANLPPEVWFEKDEIRAQPGHEIVIDGRGSYDRDRDDMDHLAFWWELVARPAGSRVLLQDRRASRLVVTPDTGGTYVFRLRVGDGKVWCAPRAVTVECFAAVPVAARKPGGISGLDKAEPRALRHLRRLYLDVLGRPPTPAEALAEERQGIDALVANLLLRAEMGRAWVEAVAIRFGLYGDFRPTGSEAADLALRVPSEGLPPHVVEGVLARDPSFLRRHPPGRPLAEAVAGLLLGRAPTREEVEGALALAAGRATDMPGVGHVTDAAAWVRAIVQADAFRRAATERRIRHFLPSGDAARALGPALQAVAAGPAAWRRFLQGVLRDPRYLDRASLRRKDDVTFLRGLFVDLLERKPTDRELAAMLQAVHAMGGDTAAFAALVRVLIDSGEAPIPLLVDIDDAPRWITDRFLRTLGRRPSAAELKAYGRALLDPHGGPELVMQALLTGPEYACR